MKKIIYEVICIAMLILAVISIYGALTVTGSGFLDLSNWAKYFLLGFAAILILIAIVIGIKGWRK